MRRPENVKYLPRFERNQSISTEVLNQLPPSWRLYWREIDLSQYNFTREDTIEHTTKKIEEIESEITQEELLLDEEKTKRLGSNRIRKSIALGEMDVQGLDEETKPEVKQSWEDIDRLSKTPFNVKLVSSKRMLESKRKEILEIRKRK